MTAPRRGGERAGPSLARNVFSNWTVTAASVGYSLFITPIVVRALSQDLYGIWSFLNGLIAYADLLYLGLGSALIKHVAKYTADRDQAGVNRVASVVLSIYSTIGVACLIGMTAVAGLVPRLFAASLASGTAAAARDTSILLGVQLLCVFVGSGFTGVLFGRDRFDLVNVVRLVMIGARSAVMPLAVHGANPLLGLAVTMAVSTVVETVVLVVLAYRVDRDLHVRPTLPNAEELSSLYKFGVQSFLIVCAVRLISYTDTTVIGVLLGASSVAIYVLPLQLIEFVRLVLVGFSGVLLPKLTVSSASGDMRAVQRSFVLSVRVGATLAAFLAANLAVLGAPFLALWVGPEYAASARWIIVALGAATVFQVYNSLMTLPYYQALHLMAVPARVLMLEGLVNLILSVVFARMYGVVGVAFATLLPTFFVSFLTLSRYLSKHLELPVSSVVWRSLGPAALIAALVLATNWLLKGIVPDTSYGALFVRAAASAVPALVAAVACSSPEERQRARAALFGSPDDTRPAAPLAAKKNAAEAAV